MSIKLKDIWPIENVGDYKVHFARYNGHNEPLDEWLEDPDNWVYWQAYRPQRNEFNRDFIFTLMRFYPEEDVWLFGGVFRVLADHGYGNGYEVELTDHGADFIGRLKIFRAYRNMSSRVKFENHYDDLQESPSRFTRLGLSSYTSFPHPSDSLSLSKKGCHLLVALSLFAALVGPFDSPRQSRITGLISGIDISPAIHQESHHI